MHDFFAATVLGLLPEASYAGGTFLRDVLPLNFDPNFAGIYSNPSAGTAKLNAFGKGLMLKDLKLV